MPVSVVTISATAPPDAIYADWAMTIAESAYVNSGAVAVISAAYIDTCDAISGSIVDSARDLRMQSLARECA